MRRAVGTLASPLAASQLEVGRCIGLDQMLMRSPLMKGFFSHSRSNVDLEKFQKSGPTATLTELGGEEFPLVFGLLGSCVRSARRASAAKPIASRQPLWTNSPMSGFSVSDSASGRLIRRNAPSC